MLAIIEFEVLGEVFKEVFNFFRDIIKVLVVIVYIFPIIGPFVVNRSLSQIVEGCVNFAIKGSYFLRIIN